MKKIALALLLLGSVEAHAAQEFRFEGEFVETYRADRSFLSKIPAGTELNCGKYTCYTRGVRIFVFRNGDATKWFWSTKVSDVFDEEERINNYGKEGHVIYYDNTNQLMCLTHTGVEEDIRTSEETRRSVAPTYKQLIEMGDRNEEIHQKELDRRFKLETEKYNRK